MIDTQLALEAQANITWIADHWDDLKARLGGSGGGGLQIRVQTSELPPLPIDLHVSDLMAEIDWNVARHYAHILMDDDLDWRPKTMTTVDLLSGIAERYGHFVTDDRLALQFCDDAADYRGRVEKTLERPAPPVRMGPCRVDECAGELYARGSASTLRCPVCLTETTIDAQRIYLAAELDNRFMTITEIGVALKIIDNPVPPGTLRRWASAGTLASVDEGLYRLKDAIEQAERRKVRA